MTNLKHTRRRPRRVLEFVDELPPMAYIGLDKAKSNREKAKRSTFRDLWGPLAKEVLSRPGEYGLIDVMPIRNEKERKAFNSRMQAFRHAGKVFGFVVIQRTTPDGKSVRIYGYAPASTNGTA